MRKSIIVRSSFPSMWGVYDDREPRYWSFAERQDAIDFARGLAAERRSAIVQVYTRIGRLELREVYTRNGPRLRARVRARAVAPGSSR
jgi:hypothetical protein